jgi:hypothetical protein
MGGGSLAEATDVNWFNARFKLQIFEASQHLFHRHAEFHSGEVNTETNVRSATEGKMALWLAVDVEDVGVVPTLRIAVGDSDNKIHKCSGGNGNTFNFRIGNCCAPE